MHDTSMGFVGRFHFDAHGEMGMSCHQRRANLDLFAQIDLSHKLARILSAYTLCFHGEAS